MLRKIFALETSSMAIELVSNGEGKINGIFSKAISIFYSPLSLTLLSKRAGSPLSVLLTAADLECVRGKAEQNAPVFFENRELIINNGIIINFSRAVIRSDYGERARIGLSAGELSERLGLIRDFLNRSAAHNSLANAFLGKNDKSISWQENFASVFYRGQFYELRRTLKTRDRSGFVAALARFQGCGIGLTPSGDDFLSGFLSAIRLLDAGEKTGWIIDGLRASLTDAKTNTWGWSILLPALDGSIADIVANAVDGLCRKGETDTVLELSELGSSSGFDHIVGISFALETVLTLLRNC